MFSRKLYARVLVPAAAVVAANNEELLCKPSELPIYTIDDKIKKEAEKQEKEPLPPPNRLEKFFGTIRKSIFSLSHEAKMLKLKTNDLIQDTQDNFDWLINYLQEEENTNAKYGAIAIGGLAGYILGLRGRFFRRTIFATAGAVGMASVCYPSEAAEYSELAIEESRKYATIAYNFIYGVTKDDPPLELPSLPKVPTSLGEAWNAATGVGKSITSLFSENGEESEGVERKIIKAKKTDEVDIEVDAEEVVAQVYEEATNKACHCPIGICTRHDEQPPAENSIPEQELNIK